MFYLELSVYTKHWNNVNIKTLSLFPRDPLLARSTGSLSLNLHSTPTPPTMTYSLYLSDDSLVFHYSKHLNIWLNMTSDKNRIIPIYDIICSKEKY